MTTLTIELTPNLTQALSTRGISIEQLQSLVPDLLQMC